MSEPTKVTVYVAPEGTWLEIVGEDDALDLTRPVRVVFERDYAKLAQALTLATQRAEAAEADARSAWMEYAGEKETSAQCLAYLRQSEDMVDTLTAERDALRQVDDAMVERAANAMAFAHGGRPIGTYADGTQAAMRKEARAALDAALAVQP